MRRRDPQRGVTLPEIVISVALLIVVAVVSIGRFQGYIKKSKQSGANIHLKSIERGAKRYFVEMAAFPVGSATSPDRPCCSYPDQRCPTGYRRSSDRVWQQLDVTLDDDKFQFSYQGTSTTVLVTASGDPDCDGKTVTYTLHGTATDGYPSFNISSSD